MRSLVCRTCLQEDDVPFLVFPHFAQSQKDFQTIAAIGNDCETVCQSNRLTRCKNVHFAYNSWLNFCIFLQVWEVTKVNNCYNIVRMLALYNSYWAAMNKNFINARLSVNKDFFHDDVFSCVFHPFILTTKYPKIYGKDEKLSGSFGIELLATQTNSKSGEDVSQIIEPESLKSLPERLTFSWKKTTNWSVSGNIQFVWSVLLFKHYLFILYKIS